LILIKSDKTMNENLRCKKVKVPRHILLSVEKPARYVGGEFNSVIKNPGETDIRFAFCFPDIYDIGMSHLGMKILYHMINARADAYCERCFMPWTDMISEMKKESIPLFSLETGAPISGFDIVGFTLQYEMSYSNVLAMLDMAEIPLFSKDRGEDYPLIIAGGPCAFNAEPVACFFDVVLIGEGEEQLNIFLDLYSDYKSSGIKNKQEFLRNVAMKVPGAYVPSLYTVNYNDDGTIENVLPVEDGVPKSIRKAIVMDMDNSFYPDDFIVPNTEVVHDRVFLEMFRGCSRGCRFCQAGFITRPVREKSPGTLLCQAQAAQEKTGYDEIGLLSLSTGDYSKIKEFSGDLMERLEQSNSSLSLPSLRVDSFSLDLMEKAQKTRKSGLTFAPEAGTDRLRNVINKDITEENILSSLQMAFEGGWSSVKLYFMTGLPGETMEDIEGIAELVKKITNLYYALPREMRRRKLEISVSAAIFIPKPFTPFQWEPQEELDSLINKQKKLRELLRSKNVRFMWHGGKTSLWEAVLARGDRRLSNVIYKAYKRGCIFDAWDDHFNFEIYKECMEEEGLEISFYANRRREYTEVLPWEHIDAGVTKSFLIRESKNAFEEKITPGCMENCTGCGAAVFDGGICFEQR
jgi:radical SAM family uncharacterized protein